MQRSVEAKGLHHLMMNMMHVVNRYVWMTRKRYYTDKTKKSLVRRLTNKVIGASRFSGLVGVYQ